jgi:hypothetical protein
MALKSQQEKWRQHKKLCRRQGSRDYFLAPSLAASLAVFSAFLPSALASGLTAVLATALASVLASAFTGAAAVVAAGAEAVAVVGAAAKAAVENAAMIKVARSLVMMNLSGCLKTPPIGSDHSTVRKTHLLTEIFNYLCQLKSEHDVDATVLVLQINLISRLHSSQV